MALPPLEDIVVNVDLAKGDMAGVSHDERKRHGGFQTCPGMFRMAADDVFFPWRDLEAWIAGAQLYALERKHGHAPPTIDPDLWEIFPTT
jgi:hypothetical protein